MEFDIRKFQNPTEEYRLHPFWFWNGEMTEEEISRQYDEMQDKGVGGVFICARQGITVPYLSQGWFEIVRFGVEEAKKRNMHVWLYDEYPYPSGIAGGEVTLQHPDAKQYTLEHTTERVEGGALISMELPWARILYAKAVPVGGDGNKRWEEAVDISRWIGNYQAEQVFQKAGLTAYTDKRYFSYGPVQKLEWSAPQGEWELIILQEKEIGDFKYYGTYVDPAHREAMETFIRVTHDRFAEELGEYFGTTIKGMFTDETFFVSRIPWSPIMPEYFQEKYGYDLREHLPALLYEEAEGAAQVRYDFFQAAHELLLENYHKLISDWCEKHGLSYVTEVPSMRMTTQLYSHVPGGDTAHEKVGRSLEWVLNRYQDNIRGNAKMVSSIARQLERERNLIECFHSVGWSMTLQDAKWMIDRMAAQGVNFFNPHAFFYTLNGLTKHDAPPSQFLQNPYWRHFKQLGDYTGRISYVMSCGTAEAPIAVLFPITTYWTHMVNPNRMTYCGTEAGEKKRVEQLKKEWVDICNHLTFIQRDYDHLDPELLERAKVENGMIELGNASYSMLIIPPITNLETRAWHKIREFLESGGKVISIGHTPVESIDKDSSTLSEIQSVFGLSDEASRHPGLLSVGNGEAETDLNGLTHLLNELLPASIKLESDRSNKSFMLQIRKMSENSAVVFLNNHDGDSHNCNLIVDAAQLWTATGLNLQDGQLECRELSLDTGEVTSLGAERTGNSLFKLPLLFAPYQSRLIQLTWEKNSKIAEAGTVAEPAAKLEMSVEGPWQLRPERNNMVRFDIFSIDIRSQQGESRLFTNGKEAKVPVKTFIDQCSDLAAFAGIPVVMSQHFGTPLKTRIAYPLKSIYRVSFQVEELPSECRLVMDKGAISGEWRIRVNDGIVTSESCAPYYLYDYLNIGADIREYLKPGANEITVEVDIQCDWDGLVEAIHLEGDFGVSHDKDKQIVLTRKVEQTSGLKGGLVNGYPYYAGTLCYKRIETITELPDTETFVLTFRDWDTHFHDCAEVLVNGQSLGVRSWTPYSWEGSSSVLQNGENLIEIRVTNTLVGLLEGKTFNYATHKIERIEDLL
ncbi:glycosyl hydrolase [Paenibacillus radicis (ex Xue et al. 2023)]|uniref:Glycosyl hydrolase n=1 Tax=Paenibacillus radicis (ex Xue et al. 2023) TaxID=2972489 RepID=A0ABT1YSM4_9BACL|nr:glycosyl hydrolase [Paenibacillus radicis (ex Xue et al. 2023)]MCR8635354.1 glycosyl hydrolase [Paenibacillus radicis (ex Xue et al. 2023)]